MCSHLAPVLTSLVQRGQLCQLRDLHFGLFRDLIFSRCFLLICSVCMFQIRCSQLSFSTAQDWRELPLDYPLLTEIDGSFRLFIAARAHPVLTSAIVLLNAGDLIIQPGNKMHNLTCAIRFALAPELQRAHYWLRADVVFLLPQSSAICAKWAASWRSSRPTCSPCRSRRSTRRDRGPAARTGTSMCKARPPRCGICFDSPVFCVSRRGAAST